MTLINKIQKERPDWTSQFILHAFHCSLRSHDAQTQCGAVLVASDNTIISDGYNGFIRGIDDNKLPNLRPTKPKDYGNPTQDKYIFMIHSEHNAILNAARQGKSTLGATVYVTGEPCCNCLQYMIQAGITKIVFTNVNKANMTVVNPDYKKTFDLIVELTGIDIEEIDIDKINPQFLLEKLSKIFVDKPT
jgi:dCMP deaminase